MHGNYLIVWLVYSKFYFFKITPENCESVYVLIAEIVENRRELNLEIDANDVVNS